MISVAKTWRHSAPIALVAIFSFFFVQLPVWPANAGNSSATAPLPLPDGTGGPSTLATGPAPANSTEGLATVDLATGAAQTSFKFDMPVARGAAQPSLGLTYSSSHSVGFAGVGWTISLPSIVRKGTAGAPRFIDAAISSAANLSTNYTSDDYYIDGHLLVAICLLSITPGGGPPHCAFGSAIAGEAFPTDLLDAPLSGWTYFRRQIDDGSRYFLSPNGQTWLQQVKSGRVRQFGVSLDKLFGDKATERPSPSNAASVGGNPNVVYRWNLVRDTDASGNTVYYIWTDNRGSPRLPISVQPIRPICLTSTIRWNQTNLRLPCASHTMFI